MSLPVINQIINFLESVGISVICKPITADTFLPGLQLENGKLVVDHEKLKHPGDLLHEAGHLATMPPSVRETMDDILPDNDLNMGGEMMAIAWSYAACIHVKLDPAIVFHAAGYKGKSEGILQNFTNGQYIAIPLLQWAGMALDEKNAAAFNTLPYPHMIRWLRER